MREPFVDNRYLTDMLSIVLGFNEESIKDLSPEHQTEVFKHLHNVREAFNQSTDVIG